MKQKIFTFGGASRRQADSREKAVAAVAARRRKRRTGRQTLNYLLLLITAAAVMAALSLTVFFHIEQLKVSGNTKYAAEELIAGSGIQVGDNLFRVSERSVEKKLIEQFPYVESIELKRTLPATLTIEITQVKPLGAVNTAAGYVVVGENGRILEAGAQSLSEEMTVVTGMYLSSPTVGRVLGSVVEDGEIIYPDSLLQEEAAQAAEAAQAGEEAVEMEESQRRQLAAEAEEESFKMLSYLVDAVRETSFEKISLVDFSDRLNIMMVYDGRVMIELGSESDLAYKLKFAQKVILEELSEEFEGVVDASYSKKIYTRPGDIEQKLLERQLLIQQEQQAAQQPQQPDETNPELAIVPGSAPVSSSGEEETAVSSSEAETPSSSYDELAVIPDSAPVSSTDESSGASSG